MSTEPTDVEGDDSLSSLDDLFIDKSYTLRHYTFTPAHPITSFTTPSAILTTASAPLYQVSAYSLHQATTAYDLTGQLVWPATDILASYLLSPLASTVLAPPLSVLELGCGVGLLSLLCLHLSPPPVALHCTDHNPHVLSLLQTNLALQPQQQQSTLTTITIQQLDWRHPGLTLLPSNLSLILGSDLVYSTVDVEALIRLLYAILSRHRMAVAVVSWLTRWHNVDRHMYDTLAQLKAGSGGGGLVWEEVGLGEFMRLELFDDRVGRDGHLLCIRWKDT